MKSKTMFFGAAAAIALSATTVSVAPAQALSITPGSEINFNSPVGGRATIGLDKINFTPDSANQRIQVTSGSGSFADVIGPSETELRPILSNLSPTTVLDLVLSNGIYNGPTIPDFISGIKIGRPVGNLRNLSFDLTSATVITPGTLARFVGLFRSGSTILSQASGDLTAQGFGNGGVGTSYSLTLTAQPIPTPALLPGLIGLGMGVLRKRKKEMAAASTEA
jgi:hypothetical protein